MKQEPCFKYLAAALITGVILAFAQPAAPPDQPNRGPVVTTTAPSAVSAKG